MDTYDNARPGAAAPRRPRAYVRGFTNLERELPDQDLPVEGHIPHWLHGSLLRNGPALFDLPNGGAAHWFDGLAMLHAFSFSQGRVRYRNRFLRSGSYKDARAHSRLSSSAFAADPCRSLFSRLFTVLSPDLLDNANVGIAQVAGRFIAMTETPMAVVFDPRTLATLGYADFQDHIRGSLTTAHPLFDAERGLRYSYLTRFGVPSRYQIVTMGARRRLVSSLPVAEPAYMHSFAMSERFIVLAEFPFLLSLPDILSAEVPLIGAFRWRPQRATRFLVFDKRSGALVRVCQAPACFGFHHVNAYETADGLVLDVVVYPDPSIIDQLYRDALAKADRFPTGELCRFVLPRGGGAARVTRLSQIGIELPQIDERLRGRPYRYAFGVNVSSKGDFLDQIVRVDVRRGAAATWSEPGCYPGEPVFVPAPDAQREGEGVLLAVVLDGRRGDSFLLVLDALTLGEIGRARVSHHIPFGLHGLYASDI